MKEIIELDCVESYKKECVFEVGYKLIKPSKIVINIKRLDFDNRGRFIKEKVEKILGKFDLMDKILLLKIKGSDWRGKEYNSNVLITYNSERGKMITASADVYNNFDLESRKFKGKTRVFSIEEKEAPLWFVAVGEFYDFSSNEANKLFGLID